MATMIDKMPGFKRLSKDEREAFADPLWDNNPIMIQVLGICSALAVTTQMQTSVVMSCALVTVLCVSNVAIAVLRNFIPPKTRIIVQLAVIASLVIVIDQFLKAYLFEMSKQLSVFVGLIITNCIVMGRAEGYAMNHRPFESLLDGLGNGIGYSAVLCLVATGREILGKGTWFGMRVIPESIYSSDANPGGYVNVGLMVLPPGAFILLGLIIWAHGTLSNRNNR